jgi:hypothetical protein
LAAEHETMAFVPVRVSPDPSEAVATTEPVCAPPSAPPHRPHALWNRCLSRRPRELRKNGPLPIRRDPFRSSQTWASCSAPRTLALTEVKRSGPNRWAECETSCRKARDVGLSSLQSATMDGSGNREKHKVMKTVLRPAPERPTVRDQPLHHCNYVVVIVNGTLPQCCPKPERDRSLYDLPHI